MPKGQDFTPIPIPIRGVIQNISSYLVPLNAVASASNVFVDQRGELVSRYGFAQLGSGNEPGARIMGMFEYTSGDASLRQVAGTTNGIWHWVSGSDEWANITGSTTLTGANDDQISFATFPSGGNTHLIVVNDTNVPQTWNGDAATVAADLGGSPPIARDITVAANRVILGNVVEAGTRSVNRLRVSNINDHTTWDAANTVDLADTDDFIVSVEVLNRTAFAIHKSDSQWLGLAQQAVFPFRFELVDSKPGPVSTNSVVNVHGQHFYIGNDMSVYAFNGTRSTDIGRQIKRWLRDNFDWNLKKRCHGHFHQALNQIYWFFKSQSGSDIDTALIYDLDRGAFWPQAIGGVAISGAYRYDDNSGSSVAQDALWGGVDGTVYLYSSSSTNDAGTAIAANWETAPRPFANLLSNTQARSLDTFFAQASASTNVTVSTAVTNTLATTLSFTVAGTVDVNVDQRHEVDITDTRARFLALRHNASLDTTSLRWKGGAFWYDTPGIS